MSSRVVLFAHNLAPVAPTGVYRYATELTRALARMNLNEFRFEVCSTRRPRDEDLIPAQMRVRTLPGPRRPIQLGWAKLSWPTIDLLIGRPDLLHVATPVVPVPTRAPLVVTIHDLLPIHHPEWYTARERWLFDRATRHAADEATRVMPNSEATGADVIATLGIPPERVSVVPHAARPEFSGRPDPTAVAATCRRHNVDPGRFVLFVGGVWPRKNIGVLFDALSELRANSPDLCLVVAGPIGEDSKPILAQAEKLGLGSSVRFTGFLPDSEIHALLAAALCLTHPSLYEGFGVTPLEAMSVGCPVICSDSGALPEVVTGAGLLVPPDRPDAWREAIERLEGDRALRETLIAAGRVRADDLSWDACARRTAAVYSECISGR